MMRRRRAKKASAARSSAAAAAAADAGGRSGGRRPKVTLASTVEEYSGGSGGGGGGGGGGDDDDDDWSALAKMREYFRTHSVEEAGEFRAELQARRQTTATALKRYANRHYRQFINTASEITRMESDVLKLRSLLSDYGLALRALGADQSLRLSYHTPVAEPPLFDDEAAGGGGGGGYGGGPEAAAGGAEPSGAAAVSEMIDSCKSFVLMGKLEHAVNLVPYITREVNALKRAHRAAGGGGDDERPGRRHAPAAALGDGGGGDAAAARRYARTLALVDVEQRLRDLVARLVALLVNDCVSLKIPDFQRRRTFGYLVRLNHADTAVRLFLQRRSHMIKTQIRLLDFEGDSASYIDALSRCVFRAISSTAADFRALLERAGADAAGDDDAAAAEAAAQAARRSADAMMSAVVVWARDELATFVAIFNKQVFLTDDSFEKVSLCLRAAFRACKELEAAGISLTFVLARALTPSLLGVIRRNYREVEEAVQARLKRDTWHVGKVWVFIDDDVADAPGGGGGGGGGGEGEAAPGAAAGAAAAPREKRALNLSDSARFLYNVIRTVLANVTPILDASVFPSAATDLYPTVVNGMVRLLERYLLTMAQEAKTKLSSIDDNQSLSIVANAFFLAEDLLPRVLAAFSRVFGRSVPEVEAFMHKLVRLHRALQDSFCQKRVPVWISDILSWEALAASYGRAAALAGVPAPSGEMLALVKYFGCLKEICLNCLNADCALAIISLSLCELLRTLANRRYWRGRRFSRAGANQCVLDVRFLLAAGRAYQSTRTRTAAVALEQCAVRAAGAGDADADGAGGGEGAAAILQPREWFTAAISRALEKVPTIAEYVTVEEEDDDSASDDADAGSDSGSGSGSSSSGSSSSDSDG